MEDPRLTLTEDEKLKIEYSSMFDKLEIMVPKMSKRDLQRVFLLMISPEFKEAHYLKKLKHQNSKQVYVFANKCTSIKYAQLYQKLMKEHSKKETK